MHKSNEHTGRWSDQEHNLFIQAVALYGRKWIKVAEHVGTRTTIQVRSHAQKFEAKNGGKEGLASLMEKRRHEMMSGGADAEGEENMGMASDRHNQRSYSCPTRYEGAHLDQERTPSWTSVAQLGQSDPMSTHWSSGSRSDDISASSGALSYEMATPPRQQALACLQEDEFAQSAPASWADANDAAMMLSEESEANEFEQGPVVYQDSRRIGASGVDSITGVNANGVKVCRRRSSTLLDELMDFIEDDVPLDTMHEENAMGFAMEEDL